MRTETAADLAGMFDQAEFAEPANYQAPGGGSAVACSVIVNRGQARQRFRSRGDEAAVATADRMLFAQQSELGAIARDGLFTMLDLPTELGGVPTGEVFKVLGKPKLDETAALWTVELLIMD